jgi:lipopolysaccharide/colanic/teichoic acid biosynthesis glycosyltransferase
MKPAELEKTNSAPLQREPAPRTARHAAMEARSREIVTVQRAFDVVLAVAGAVVAAPLLAATALAVWCSLGRPILFRQVRAGRHGRPFEILKLRTMSDARDASGSLLPDEMRMTLTGRFLRRGRLDELPQIFNVLRADISVVGPRALPCGFMDSYPAARDRRQAVRPGLTGWAQVNGNTRLNEIEKLSLDVWYVDHRSMALDVLILFQTALVIARGERIKERNLKKARAHALRRYGLG